MTSLTPPSSVTDTYVYNGLGLRVGKTDSTGSYSYFCDGASPGSPALSDGHATYTPGLSESRGGVSTYAASDVLGNLWFLDNAGAAQTYYQDTTAFGTLSAVGGTDGTPFKFGGANGCQSDADTGLVLMGHRYYDTRIGRFISQDPAGSGDNWYAYADNDPVDEVDPTGLEVVTIGLRSPVPSTFNIFDNWGASTQINYITYQGFSPKDVQKIKGLIKIINTTPVGHALVKKATESKREYKIVYKKGKLEGDSRTRIAYIDLNRHPEINTVDGPIPASSLRILAHEFGHTIGGYLDVYDPANFDTGNQMMNIDHSENPIMTSIAGPGAARTSYNYW